MPKDPESLGEGVGTLLADAVPLLPSGARRAGAAKVMAARIGHDPSVLVNHPIKSQLLALGLGGAGAALTEGQNRITRASAALGPIALVQLLRHLELRKIQTKYDREKRKRLSELDTDELFDNGALGLGGSSRLGAVNAYETMRARKYRGFGSLAEAGDAIQLAAGAVSPALYSGSIPLISAIDNHAADQLLKRAEFTDQQNSPALPLYLAAAALSSAGLGAASQWAHREDANTPALGAKRWDEVVRSMTGTSPLLLGTEGTGNAFFYKPRSASEATQFLLATAGLRNHTAEPMSLSSITGAHDDRVKRLQRFGAIVADSDTGAPTIAHEAGHAKIEETPGILRALQRHVYPHSRLLAPLAGAGSMAAGLASGSAGKGALLGAGIGALTGAGMIAPEMGASYHALKHLDGAGDGKLSAEARKDLLSALSTYLAASILPGTLAGAAGGWISGRRKKREGEEEEQEKSAGEQVTTHTKTLPDGTIVDILRLVELLQTRPPTRRRLDELTPPSRSRASGFSEKRYAAVDTSKPVIVDGDGELLDGRHRYFRLRDAGETSIDAVTASQEDITAATEKAAAADPRKLWEILTRAQKIKGHLGSDAADRHTLEHLGSVYRAARGRFFNNPQVQSLGIKPGTRAATIEKLLLPAAPPTAPKSPDLPTQGVFDFFKEGGERALPGLLQAKQHSDTRDYRRKNLMLRQLMDEAPADWVIDSDDGKGIVGVTHVPTGFKLHMPKDRVSPGVITNSMSHPNEIKKSGSDTLRDTLIGAGLGAALPVASHARYELLERPAYRKQILDLVARASAEKKLFAAPRAAGYAEWSNPLQKKMRLGDVILQSHNGVSFREMLRDRMPDFTTLSLGGSGSGTTHAALSTGGGRAIDPGKESLTAFKDGILKLLAKPSAISVDGIRSLGAMRRIHPRDVADTKYLKQHSVDAFESAFLRPNVSVVMRPENRSGVSRSALLRHLADIKSVGYSSTDAAAAALKRLALPTRPSYGLRGKPDLSQGTFCSHGGCSVQALKGLSTPKLRDVLPPDLLRTEGQSLVGIGVNRGALDALKGTGLRGDARLAEAAKRTMLSTLGRGANTRRIFAGGVTGLMAGAGALGGWLGNKVMRPDDSAI